MKNIQNIYEMLHWENPPETRMKGMCLAKKEKDLSLLIMPTAHPSVWEACAQVLSDKTDEELKPYLPDLLEWLNDINWPGGHIIFNRLLSFSGEKLKYAFVECVESLLQCQDEDNNRWLYFLSELLSNRELKDKLPKNLVAALYCHRKKWEIL